MLSGFSRVLIQANSDKQKGKVEDLTLFRARKQVFPKTIFKTNIWRSFSIYLSQNTLILSDSHEVPILNFHSFFRLGALRY